MGIRTTYAYNAQDELDHIIQQPVKGAEETAIRHDFSYDALGRLIKKVNHEDIITYGYQQQQTLLQRYTEEEWHLAEEAQREAKAYDILELGYNKLGWLTAEKGPTGDFIYQYDPAANLFDDHTVVQGNQLQQYKQLQFSYDGFGRMKTRQGHNGAEKQRFHYDSEHRLKKGELLNHRTILAVEFTYDALGRQSGNIRCPLLNCLAALLADRWTVLINCGGSHG